MRRLLRPKWSFNLEVVRLPEEGTAEFEGIGAPGMQLTGSEGERAYGNTELWSQPLDSARGESFSWDESESVFL